MIFKQFGYIVSFWLRREDFKKVPFRLFGGKLVRAEWIHVCIWLILCCPSEAIRTLFIFSVCLLSHFGCVQLFVALWTVACQAPLSMEFSSQEYWSGLPCPPAGDLPDPGIKPTSLMSPALASRFFTTSTTWEVPFSAMLQHKTKRIKKKKFLSGSEYQLSIWPTSDHLNYIWGKKIPFKYLVYSDLSTQTDFACVPIFEYRKKESTLWTPVCLPSHLFNALSLTFIHESVVHSFLLLLFGHIVLYKYTTIILFIFLLFFWVSAIINKSTMNFHVQPNLWTCVFISFG